METNNQLHDDVWNLFNFIKYGIDNDLVLQIARTTKYKTVYKGESFECDTVDALSVESLEEYGLKTDNLDEIEKITQVIRVYRNEFKIGYPLAIELFDCVPWATVGEWCHRFIDLYNFHGADSFFYFDMAV
tara:strand:+ start:453 stop:845 length:393 start_codon:yes stop_codon:yes gene_type:complete